MHMHTCMRVYVTMQKLRWHRNYCELILSLARAFGMLSFTARPTTVSMKSVARCCSLKKFIQFHTSQWSGRRCSVAQASFNHPRWCRPRPVCLWFALETCPQGSFHQEFHFHHLFTRVFWNKHYQGSLEQTHKKTMKYKYDCMNSRHKVRGLSVPLLEENTKMYAPAGCTSSQAVQVMDTTIVYNWCSKSSRSSQPCTYSDCGREWVKVEEWQNFVKSRHALESRCEFC